jgi:RNA 2',3'-cyclic 3'-phosphodiesterase
MSQNASSSSRLFLAVVPDADAAARIYRLARALKQAHKFDRDIIEPERLHVSLFFLGELSEHMFRIACEAAAEVRAHPFEVRFDRSVSFRGRPGNRPFVLVGNDGLKPLTVREVMEAALTAKGQDPDAEKIAKIRAVFNNALRNQVGKTIRVIRDGPWVRWDLINRD